MKISPLIWAQRLGRAAEGGEVRKVIPAPGWQQRLWPFMSPSAVARPQNRLPPCLVSPVPPKIKHRGVVAFLVVSYVAGNRPTG